MNSFEEIQFPSSISWGSSGGPMFSTDIATMASGHEQRCINWHAARGRYNVGSGVKSKEQWEELIAFFRARRGRGVGFRFKDWSDYTGINQRIGVGDGNSNKFQLVKHYTSGTSVYSRVIKKPVRNNSCKIYIDSFLCKEWQDNGAIEGVNEAIDEEIDEGVHINFTTGEVLFDTPPKKGEEISADFEFDVPVRFDHDHLDLSMDSFSASSWSNITLIELKI